MSVATIRARVAAKADQLCQVLESTLTQVDGASVPTWTAEGAPCPCRVKSQARLPREEAAADQRRAVQRWVIVFAVPLPGDFTLTPERRIAVGADTYEVLNSDQGRAHPTEVQVECLKVG